MAWQVLPEDVERELSVKRINRERLRGVLREFCLEKVSLGLAFGGGDAG